MTKSLAIVAGIAMVGTQTTPFDLAGAHISQSPLVELSICVLTILVVLASEK